jgi:hypothetical protein
MNLIDSLQDSLEGWSARRKAATYTGQHKHTPTDIHASSGIPTHDTYQCLSARAKTFPALYRAATAIRPTSFQLIITTMESEQATA